MEATDLIFKLRSVGYSIIADGFYLDISPADNLPPDLVNQLKKSKPEILCALHQEEELRLLVRLVSDHNNFSQEESDEALTYALRDPVNALICFTSLAHKAELI